MVQPKTEKHRTAQLILQSAKKKFLKKGFAGTSINDLANDANVHKSLIYHHFGNKEKLWKAVKKHILDEAIQKSQISLDFPLTGFKEYLKAFVRFRFEFYAQNPEIVRLMSWQRLESHSNLLTNISSGKLTNIASDISTFQTRKEIRQDIPSEIISYLIISTASNGFMDKEPFLKNRKAQEEYLQIIIEGLFKMLNARVCRMC